MLPLRTFWQAIESVPGLATVLPEWRDCLGEDFARVRSRLLPTDQFAASLRMPADPHVEYRVVQHGPDDIVGVRDGDGSTVTLSKLDVLIYRLDYRRVLREVAAALGFDGTLERLDGLAFTFRMGAALRPLAGFSCPAFVTFPLEAFDLQRALEAVSARSDGSFVFLAPTARYKSSACESLLMKRKACFLALNDAIEIGPNGTWIASAAAKPRLADFQNTVIPKSTTSNGMVFFPTPSNATWADLRIKFLDGHSVTVTIGGESGTFVYSQLGMADGRNAKPTKQWDLLKAFADGFGTLTWKSPSASRNNQKRKENLARDLKAFFRLDGEPILFVHETKGWRTLFGIEPDG